MSTPQVDNSPSTTTKDTSDKKQNKHTDGRTDEAYAVKLKKEYILTERASSLPPLPPDDDDDDDDVEYKNNTNDNNRGGGGGGGNRNDNNNRRRGGKKKKRERGMNKKRPRDAKIAPSHKMCIDIVRGKECPFGDDCKYSHDIKALLAVRPHDIVEVEGGCPTYNLYGHCDFGVNCRLGSSHINMATGANIQKPECEIPNPPPPPVMNVIDKTTQTMLRKNKYPFVCKRAWEEKKEKRRILEEEEKKKKKKKEEEEEKKSDDDNDGKEDTNTKEEEGTNQNENMDVDDKTNDENKDTTTTTTTNNPTTTTKENKNNVIMDVITTTTPLPTKTRKLIDFRNKIYIAPLTTVGNLPFRRIMKHYGADITCGEMAVATNLLQGGSSEWALLKRHPCEDVFGVQIAAGFPDQYTRCAEVLERECNIDFIDLNLGCPIDLINKSGSGAALMLHKKRLKGSLEGIAKSLSCPITVKMRTGWDEKTPTAHELVRSIQGWEIPGLSAVMIHGRSRLQRYTKYADWNYIEKVATNQNPDMSQIPIIGNGDIFTYTQFEEIKKRHGIESCAMLARGALIKPWLPTELKERRHWDISASERLDMLKDFVKFGLEHWGSDQQGVNNTRRFLLEWLSFLYRYVPVGLIEVLPQEMNHRPPTHMVCFCCCDFFLIGTLFLMPSFFVLFIFWLQ